MPLTHGAKLHIVSSGTQKDARALVETISKRNITIFQGACVPDLPLKLRFEVESDRCRGWGWKVQFTPLSCHKSRFRGTPHVSVWRLSP